MTTFSDVFAHLDPDPDPRVRGKQFEHVCKWLLTNDPMYKHELRRVWLWHEWPRCGGIRHRRPSARSRECKPIIITDLGPARAA